MTPPRFDERGLVPAVVVDAATGETLMLAWMNAEAWEKTIETGETWFWSRNRRALWHKGETSGNTQRVVDVGLDCDGDTVLVRVIPRGPACHRGTPTCWDIVTGGALAHLDRVIAERKAGAPAGSYTARLLADENLRIKKIGEEAAEVVHAAVKGSDEQLAEEAADLIYHLGAVLHARGLSFGHALRALHARAE